MQHPQKEASIEPRSIVIPANDSGPSVLLAIDSTKGLRRYKAQKPSSDVLDHCLVHPCSEPASTIECPDATISFVSNLLASLRQQTCASNPATVASK